MPQVLSSWKEIGQYLGKGVRTVQRWEQELGLPVRRPAGPRRHAVLAMPDELDAWTRSRAHGPGGPVIESIRSELVALRAETADLRNRMESIEVGEAKTKTTETDANLAHAPVQKSSTQRHRGTVETLEAIRGVRDDVGRLRELVLEAEVTRAESLRQRLSLAWTMWWTGENDRRQGRDDLAERALCQAETIATRVRRSLEARRVSPVELRGLLSQLKTLQRQIDETRKGTPARHERGPREMDGAAD